MNTKIINMVLVSCLLLAACAKKQPPPETETPVNIIKVKAKRVF
jgi:PBP1b-binding outer membrane lipoprotein LpoB